MSSSIPHTSLHTPSVEQWSTAQVHSALHNGDITIWRTIVAAIKRDPYGRTAHQVEEVLSTLPTRGIVTLLQAILAKSRHQLHLDECAEIAHHIQELIDYSTLSKHEFSIRSGIDSEEFDTYLNGQSSPPASLMLRMRRVADRFAKLAVSPAISADSS